MKIPLTITYRKLWMYLERHGISEEELMQETGISDEVMNALKRDELLGMDILLQIGTALACDISDICHFIPKDAWPFGR